MLWLLFCLIQCTACIWVTNLSILTDELCSYLKVQTVSKRQVLGNAVFVNDLLTSRLRYGQLKVLFLCRSLLRADAQVKSMCGGNTVFSLTLMAVGAFESFLTLARKLASGLTPAASVWTTDIWGDISDPFRRTVGCHSNSAAVNHCESFRERQKPNC